MQHTTSLPPFGAPLAVTSLLVTELPQPFADAASVLAAVHGRTIPPGALLLESCGPAGPSTRLSVVVLRALVRLHVVGRCATFASLVPEAVELLDAIGERLGARRDACGVRVDVPTCHPDPSLDDAARLCAPGVLDLVRVLAGALADGPANGARPRLAAGAFGALAFDLVDHFESLPVLATRSADADIDMVLGADLLVLDHDRGRAQVVTRGLPWETRAAVAARHRGWIDAVRSAAPLPVPAPLQPPEDVADPTFEAIVARLREHVAAGDVFQVVPSRTRTRRSHADPLHVYLALRAANPAPCMFVLGLPDGALLGASPETCLRVEDGEVEIRPIAGTVARGRGPAGEIDDDLDGRLALSLLLDPKEQAEHTMLLDLARNDVARISTAGSCRVVQQFGLERYAHVQHLVSRVRGRLRPGFDALHAYRAVANMGTVSGAPKLRAIELLRAAETTARGFYGGAVGYVLQDGRMDTAIAIRALRWSRDGTYAARAGAGVVFDSVPEREWRETELKMRATLQAVLAAEGVRP